jgi:hypothetical protein
MKKNLLNEEISRIKGMMGKIMNESFEGDSMGLPEETHEFKVGDTVSDPENLNPSPEYDGKILAIFPNLEAAEGQPGYESTIKWMQKHPQYAEEHDVNGNWYLIEWRTEGTHIQSEKDMQGVIIAPDGRNYDDYEEDGYNYDEDDDTCSSCGGSGGGEGYYRCPVCRGSGSSGRSRYRDDY